MYFLVEGSRTVECVHVAPFICFLAFIGICPQKTAPLASPTSCMDAFVSFGQKEGLPLPLNRNVPMAPKDNARPVSDGATKDK
jgi:hypothetical protein